MFSNRDSISTLKTSAWAERAFCQSCGSGLWCRLSEGPNAARLGIALGLFDDTTGMLLEQEYYVDRKNSTHTFPADRIQLTEAELMALYAPQPQPEST